ncbi:MAG: head-tail adaptor protein [Rubellimicrobium sp.]|nr:head-tail adaptor protein [Rubellimicrobium sp.]
MRAPLLRRRLVLEEAGRAPDGAGGHVVTWAPRGVLWGEVVSTSGRGLAVAGADLSRVSHRIRLRATGFGAPSRPVAGQRLREGARVFRIVAVIEADAGGRWLTCLAEEEGVR